MYSSIYRVQSSTRRLPIRALFGFMLKLVESYLSFPSEPLCVVVCPWYQPWVASKGMLSNISFTTDIWSDNNLKSYLAMTGHWISEDPTMKALHLECALVG